MDGLIDFVTDRIDDDEVRALNPVDPRMLREVAAKRAILAMWEKSSHDVDDAEGEARWYLMNEVVQALAAVYSDHADYRKEWPPS